MSNPLPTTTSLRFFVAGIPIPKGSMRGFVIPGKFGRKPRAIVTHDNTRSKPWAAVLNHEAREVASANGWRIAAPAEAVTLNCTFYLPRPRGHYGSGKNSQKLKQSAPVCHVKKPDRDKLLRNLCDAFKGVLYTDDSQITSGSTSKRYADHLHAPGVDVEISREQIGDTELFKGEA